MACNSMSGCRLFRKCGVHNIWWALNVRHDRKMMACTAFPETSCSEILACTAAWDIGCSEIVACTAFREHSLLGWLRKRWRAQHVIVSKAPPCLCFKIGLPWLLGVPFCKSIVNGRFRKSSGRLSGRISLLLGFGRFRKVYGRIPRKDFRRDPCFCICLFVFVVVFCCCCFLFFLSFLFCFVFVVVVAVIVIVVVVVVVVMLLIFYSSCLRACGRHFGGWSV